MSGLSGMGVRVYWGFLASGVGPLKRGNKAPVTFDYLLFSSGES